MSSIKPTSPTNTVTTESVKTTSSAETTSTTDSPSTLPTIAPSLPPTEPPTKTPSLPTTQPTTPSTKPTSLPPAIEPATVDRPVVVNVVINEEFKDKYEDKNSPEYRDFVGNFTNQMERYYKAKKIPNFKEVVVTSVSRGTPTVRFSVNTVEEMRLSVEAMAVYSITPRTKGVSVTHDVVLAIPNNSSQEDLYDFDFNAVEKAVGQLVGCTADCPYDVTTTPVVNKTEIGSVCKSVVGNSDAVEYYESVLVDGAITCVTVCNSLHPHPKTCYNKGICRLFSSTGPLCQCLNVDSTWYLGNDCSYPIVRTAFYIGLSVTLACLLVSLGVLTAYLVINKRKESLNKDIKNQQVNQWMAEDFEWSRANSVTGTNDAEGLGNPAFAPEVSAIHRDVYVHPAPVYQLTQPSLDTDSRQWSPSADSHNAPSFDAGFSWSDSIPHRVIPTNPMIINRPQIVKRSTSFDA
ncbi:hypothetical protein EPR50_G00199600 [Perca flavescens]|uniref:SEA domain-containing protein n=1 Tax=Perca flavescens TaxID=8167 RepID=A0A484C7K5_PERFV|nr:mucin-12-like [Perca flavescens]TDG99929.1 hypothetical protein EPR50_G00199600 [Perca flavescens]